MFKMVLQEHSIIKSLEDWQKSMISGESDITDFNQFYCCVVWNKL